MRLTFLGTGTSKGIPELRCHCRTCRSADPRDHRQRCSAIVETAGKRLLIDCGPDFRAQMLAQPDQRLDAVLLSHQHYDHVGGLDDLRPYCWPNHFPIYCSETVERDLRSRMPYSFAKSPYPGVPQYEFHTLRPFQKASVEGVEVIPLPVMHYKLPILGFRIGNLAYITDAKTLSPETMAAIHGVDTLVVNALHIAEHISHLNLEQALNVIKIASPRRAFLTHLAHQMGLHAEVEPTLPQNVRIAYDRLEIDIND